MFKSKLALAVALGLGMSSPLWAAEGGIEARMAALEARVQAAESRAAAADHPRLLRGDPVPPTAEERADLAALIHGVNRMPTGGAVGCTAGTREALLRLRVSLWGRTQPHRCRLGSETDVRSRVVVVGDHRRARCPGVR